MKFYQWSYVLLKILEKKEVYPSIIAKELDVTYAYLTKILREFINRELVVVEKKGRTVMYSLTPKGERLAISLEVVNNLLREEQ